MAVTSEKKINDDEEEKRQMDDYVSRNTRVKGDAEGMKGGTNVPETRFVFFVKMRTGKLVIGEVEVQGRQEACAELPARDLKRLARVRGGTGRQIGVRRCAGDEYEVYGDDDRVKLDFGETIEVFDVKPGSGGGDNDGDALRRRLFPYLTFIKPDNTKFILTSAMTGSKPLDEITVREAKHLLARLCMQRFLPPSAVNSNGDVKDAHSALFLRLGTRDLDDHERFWDMGLEFGERILIVVMGEICDETAAHRD